MSDYLPEHPAQQATPGNEPEFSARDSQLEGQLNAEHFSALVASGRGFRFPWPDIDALTGPLLPGWLVVHGGRPKAGKSTFLRECFHAWVMAGRRVMLVGTEQHNGLLRMLWACMRLQYPFGVALDPTDDRHLDVLEDVRVAQAEMRSEALIVSDTDLTMEKFRKWARHAYKLKMDAIILDHFSRVAGEAGEQQGANIRQIKNMADKSGMLIVTAAQLKYGEGGGPLVEHEVPGPATWAGTGNLQREGDVTLQAWRPFRPGITAKEKREAKENPARLVDLVQQQTMSIRLAAHRYKIELPPPARLYVTNAGRLIDWSTTQPTFFKG